MLKIRCSQIGNIMTNARSKKEVLSKTTISYLELLSVENTFGRKKEFSPKYITKGINVEDKSISLSSDVLKLGFMWKNEESFENDFITGTPDVIKGDIVLDVKSSWNIFTFPHHSKKLKNIEILKKEKPLYYYQLQGYMWLTGKKTSYLCYCLVDTPDSLIEYEIKQEMKKQKANEENAEIRAFVEKNHKYDDIDNRLKIKAFQIDYDENVIEEIKQRILECREFYNELVEDLTIKETDGVDDNFLFNSIKII